MDKFLISLIVLLTIIPGVSANGVTNGYFDSDLSGWTIQGNVIWNDGHAVIRDNHMLEYQFIQLEQTVTVVNNTVSFDAYVINTGTFDIYCAVIANGMPIFMTTTCDGHYGINVSGYEQVTIRFEADSQGNGVPNQEIMSIDNVENILYVAPLTYEESGCGITVDSTPTQVTLTILACMVTNGTMYKRWNESSVNHTETSTNTISGLPPNTWMAIKKDGTTWRRFLSNSTGVIIFEYTEGFSEVEFDLSVYYAGTIADENIYMPILRIMFMVGFIIIILGIMLSGDATPQSIIALFLAALLISVAFVGW